MSELEAVARLAGYVTRSSDSHAAALERRNSAILDASTAGHTNAAIARAAGLSEVSVLRIIVNAAAARPAPQEGPTHGA